MKACQNDSRSVIGSLQLGGQHECDDDGDPAEQVADGALREAGEGAGRQRNDDREVDEVQLAEDLHVQLHATWRATASSRRERAVA